MVYSHALAYSKQKKAKEKKEKHFKPLNYKIPALSDSHFWPDYFKGWISEKEVEQAHDNFEKRSKQSKLAWGNSTEPPKRLFKFPPFKTEQYTRQMSAEFLNDHRLSQGAKNLLTRLVALAGNKNEVDTNKTSLAKITDRSTRTIQRYLHELDLLGYIERLVRISALTGFDVGLKLFINDKVMPFFHRAKDVINQVLEAKNCRFIISRYVPRETETSHINNLKYYKRDTIDKLSVDNLKNVLLE